MNEPIHDPAANDSERLYSLFNHLVGLLSVLNGGFPALGVVATIVMWRLRCKQSPFLDDHGREATNFQLSLVVYVVGGMVASAIFSVITLSIGVVIVVPLAILGGLFLLVLALVGCIRGAMHAHRGQYYRYPMCIRFIREPEPPLA
ncbi:MAG TPA: DUF4870 domain-containing protein [Phycisphaerales bacterium]|nr:DUF4870 domain-containing protein [Phycisphaerales bacterium]